MARAAAREPRKANKRGAARLAAVQALYQMDLVGTGLNEILAEFESHWLGGEVEGEQYRPAEAAFFRDIVGGVVRELIKHGIDHAGLVRIDEGAGDVDVFRRHHPCRDVAAAGKLVGAGPQHGAQHRLDALERPAARQRRVDLRVEACLFTHDAMDDVAEERRLGRLILRALDLAAEPMALELGHDLVEPGAGKIHLIERLHRGEPRRAAFIGLARFVGSGVRHLSASRTAA